MQGTIRGGRLSTATTKHQEYFAPGLIGIRAKKVFFKINSKVFFQTKFFVSDNSLLKKQFFKRFFFNTFFLL